MTAGILADGILLLHLAFILFVIFGGLLCLHSPLWAGLHLPAAAWGVWIEWSGRICPLTPLENRYRALAGEQGYAGSFIEQYLLPVVYPPGLDRELQWLLGGLVIGLNLAVYGFVFWQRRKRGARR